MFLKSYNAAGCQLVCTIHDGTELSLYLLKHVWKRTNYNISTQGDARPTVILWAGDICITYFKLLYQMNVSLSGEVGQVVKIGAIDYGINLDRTNTLSIGDTLSVTRGQSRGGSCNRGHVYAIIKVFIFFFIYSFQSLECIIQDAIFV